MEKNLFFLLIVLCTINLNAYNKKKQKPLDYVKYVNPLVGTDSELSYLTDIPEK